MVAVATTSRDRDAGRGRAIGAPALGGCRERQPGPKAATSVWESFGCRESGQFRDAAKITDLTKSRGELDVGSGWCRVSGYAEFRIAGVMPSPLLCGVLGGRP